MKSHATVLARSAAALVLTFMMGCTAPPSVAPLLRAADRAMQHERQLLDDDAARHAQWLQQQRDALAAGFDADLHQRDARDEAWVREGVRVYVAAREALLRHALDLQQQNATRQHNLQQASRALGRALGLLERHDQLFAGVPDLRRWLEDSP